MIKKKKIPIKSLVLILILVELICLVFAGILGEPGREFDTSKLKRILQSLETGLFFCQIFVFII